MAVVTEFHDSEAWEQNLRDNYYDLGHYLMHRESYSDWEGMAGSELLRPAIEILRKQVLGSGSINDSDLARDSMIADLVLHQVYEALDQADHMATEIEILNMWFQFWNLLNCRWWRHSDINWDDPTDFGPTKEEDEEED